MSVLDIEGGVYFKSLPADYYTSEERFRGEAEKVFFKQWICAGHVSQVRKPGDYFTFDLLDETLIIVRDRQNSVNAFYNVCRHRGMPVCSGSGNARSLVCPYHGWNFGLDGKVIQAGQQQDELTPEFLDELSLRPAQVSLWQGFIFVNFADEQLEDVSTLIDDDHTADMALIEPTGWKIAYKGEYDVDANWKLLLENGNECYHCETVHPSFSKTMNTDGMDGFYEDDCIPLATQGMRIPLRDGKESLTLGGSYASKKLLGEFGRGTPVPAGFTTGWMVQPLYGWGCFYADHGFVCQTIPVNATKSTFVCTWFVREDAEEGVDYDLDDVTGLWARTCQEDIATLAAQQRGIKSRSFLPGPNSIRQERGIKAGLELYLGMMGEPV
jgi:phenylpropionate dioxygenase-like ring-hydroxylating dioxygenase large terminal subunit